jgi:hypothetical protein
MKKRLQAGLTTEFKENPMKNLTKKTMVLAFCSGLFVFGSGQAQAVSVSIFNVDTEGVQIGLWKAAAAGGYSYGIDVIEDFEDSSPGWYQSLSTNVGTFHITPNTLPGTGSSSYADQVGGDDAYFELRDYDEDGRFDTTTSVSMNYSDAGSQKYLDSADITELALDVEGQYSNLFFYMTDPSDIKAVTTTTATFNANPDTSGSLYPKQENESLWFVGINAGPDDFVSNITWAATSGLGGPGYTKDGFGVDDFSTVHSSVPEPASALMFGTGLLALVGSCLRRRKK